MTQGSGNSMETAQIVKWIFVLPVTQNN